MLDYSTQRVMGVLLAPHAPIVEVVIHLQQREQLTARERITSYEVLKLYIRPFGEEACTSGQLRNGIQVCSLGACSTCQTIGNEV